MFAPHRDNGGHVKKLVVLGATAVAATSIALLSTGIASSEPDANQLNVVGEPYNKAVAILKSQGVKVMFGGSIGSVLPQAQCLVDQQKVIASTNSQGRNTTKMTLMLDCSQKAADQIAETSGGAPGGRTVGGNGVTTVTPTPVGPQPGMPIPGA
jgi:hypothetical protein